MRRRTSPLGPPLFALALAAGLTTAWVAARSMSPRADRMPAPSSVEYLWAGPGIGPLAGAPDPRGARTLVLGDSRVDAGVSAALLDEVCPEAAPSAVAFAHGARTLDLVHAAGALGAERVVVQLSPLGLTGLDNPLLREMLRADATGLPPAPLRADATPDDIERWAATERAHLLARGHVAPVVDATLEWWRAKALEGRDRSATARIDARLARALAQPRRWWLRPIEPALWRQRWTRELDPTGSLADYGRHLPPAGAAAREAAARELAAALAELAADGRRVACVRLPVSPEQRALEDARVPPELLARIAADAGVPYLDLGAWEDATTDGSHLTWSAARRATRLIGEWL